MLCSLYFIRAHPATHLVWPILKAWVQTLRLLRVQCVRGGGVYAPTKLFMRKHQSNSMLCVFATKASALRRLCWRFSSDLRQSDGTPSFLERRVIYPEFLGFSYHLYITVFSRACSRRQISLVVNIKDKLEGCGSLKALSTITKILNLGWTTRYHDSLSKPFKPLLK